MNNYLVSVVIPAYNSADYISRCLDSVFNQTYKNIEVIVVNDGSNDSTETVVQSYTKLILLSKENGGACSAKMYGVMHASGDYVIFLDSDDFLDSNFISNLMLHISGRKDEVIMCDFLKNGVKENETWDYMIMNSKNVIFSQYLHGGICNRMVNKLYPREMICDYMFPIGRDMLEDAFFTAHLLERCNCLIRIPYAGYHYIRRNDSVTKSRANKKTTASCNSNQLEKDLVLSRNIPSHDLNFFVKVSIRHLIVCFNTQSDLNTFDVFKKILLITSFIRSIPLLDNKRAVNFANYICMAKSPKQMKRLYVKYILLRGSLKNKYWFMRAALRKIIIGI